MSTEPLDLDALQRLADAATDGPWSRHEGGRGVVEVEDARRLIVAEMLSSDGIRDRRRADAEFVAAARTAMPALIAEVRRLTGELAETRAETDRQVTAHAETVDKVMATGWDRAADELLTKPVGQCQCSTFPMVGGEGDCPNHVPGATPIAPAEGGQR